MCGNFLNKEGTLYMKFLKEKEKQRFSLRKYKAYGLSSALLGLTLVGFDIENVKPIVGSVLTAQASDNVPKPSGSVVQTGANGVPWELYENGYLLFKPESGKDTLGTAREGENLDGWKSYMSMVKYIGFAGKVYAPSDSNYLFATSSYSNHDITSRPASGRSSAVEYIDARQLDTSRVAHAQFMFAELTSVKTILASGWDLSEVSRLTGMFYRDYRMTTLDMSGWVWGSKIHDIGSMFYSNDTDYVDLSGVNLANVSEYHSVFYNMNSLKKVKLPTTIFGSGTNDSADDIAYWTWLPETIPGYTNKWVREDGKFEAYTWKDLIRNWRPEMAGTWVREDVSEDATLIFDGNDIAPLKVTPGTIPNLPNPKVIKENSKFLGWSRTEDGELIDLSTLTPRERVRLYPRWEAVNNKVVKTEKIPVTTSYQEDNKVAYGSNQETEGVEGEKRITTTYTVTPITGELTNPVKNEEIITPMKPKVVKVGTKPTVVETQIARKTVYQGDITAAPGTVNESEAGRDGKTITTTTYTFNAQNGTATPNKPTTATEPALNKVVKKGTKPKVEHVMNNGVKLRKTTNYTVNSETGVVTESVSYVLLKSTDLSSTDDALATGNTWEKRERLTDQAVPIEKITTYTMRPENGEVTTSVRYEIVDGQGAKKDTLDTTEDVAGKEVPVVKKGHHVLNTETGKLTSAVQYARKDGQANVWEITEPFNTNGVSGNKITKHTLNPSTGDITNEVRYEIDKSAVVGAIEAKATAKNKEIDEAGLLSEDVTALKQQVEAEKTKAIDNVNKANAVEDVIAKRDEGITAIGNISLDAAKQRKADKDKSDLASALQTAKNNALKELEAAAKAKVDEIEKADILPEDKDALKQRVASEKEKATNAIDEATTLEGVTAKLNDGKVAIGNMALPTRQDSGNKVAPLVREEFSAYHGSIEDTIEEFESNGVKVRQITKYTVSEDGTVSSKVEYRFENGKSEFDQVEEIEEQGIKILKITHYVVDENGGVSSTVRYELLDGSLEFDKVENVKDELGLIERITHYKLNSETGKFETTVSDKRVTTNFGKELPSVPQKQLPNTGDMSIVTSVVGIVTMGIGALARPKRKK